MRTLILAVGGVADFLRESEVGVLESAHHRGVDADVEGFEAIEIARGVQEAVEGFSVAALRCGETGDGAVGFGHDAHGVWRIINEPGSFAG